MDDHKTIKIIVSKDVYNKLLLKTGNKLSLQQLLNIIIAKYLH